jgi:sulfur carrier protein
MPGLTSNAGRVAVAWSFAVKFNPMKLQLNGVQRDFPDDLSVAALVEHLGMKSDRVAVELNLEIVPRVNWPDTNLKDGDKLEVVHFVGGGAGEEN